MSLELVVDAVVALGGVWIVVLTGLVLSAGSRTLLRDVIAETRLADAVAGLLTLGFLLLDAGLAALIASTGIGGGSPDALLLAVLGRVGWLLVLIAGTHLLSLCVVAAIRGNVQARRSREVRDEAWAAWSQDVRSRQEHGAR